MKKTEIIIVAVLAALLIFFLRHLEVGFFAGEVTAKMYALLIAVIFLLAGLFWGLRNSLTSGSKIGRNSSGLTVEVHSNPDGLLSERELELLLEVAKGYSNKEISERLFISENTVKKHLNNIYSKLGVKSRTSAISKAKALGILAEKERIQL